MTCNKCVSYASWHILSFFTGFHREGLKYTTNIPLGCHVLSRDFSLRLNVEEEEDDEEEEEEYMI